MTKKKFGTKIWHKSIAQNITENMTQKYGTKTYGTKIWQKNRPVKNGQISKISHHF